MIKFGTSGWRAIMGEEFTFHNVRVVVQAIAKLAFHPQAVGEVFNIGSKEEITIYNLAERVIDLCHSDSKIELIPYDIAYTPGFEDMSRRVPSIEKISRLVGYEPNLQLEEALQRIIDFEKIRLLIT